MPTCPLSVKGTCKLPYLTGFGPKKVLAGLELKRNNIINPLIKKTSGEIPSTCSSHSFSFMFLAYFLYKKSNNKLIY